MDYDTSNDPYPHRHLWQACEEKDCRTGKVSQKEKCKFCHITRDVQKPQPKK